jgi:hypothetical protein
MTTEQFNVVVENRIDLIRSVLLQKGKEYIDQTMDNPFSNFHKAIGISFHKTGSKVAWEYMTKHLQSLKDIIDDKTPKSKEAVEEKIGDIINYLILIEGMLKDDLHTV